MSNVFSFTGTVGRDAEVRVTAAGKSVLNVSVANNVGFGDHEQTLWVRVAVWGKRADGQLVGYLLKGQKIFVSGELSQNEYQANDGTTKTSLELNASIIDLIGKKGDNNPQQGQNRNPCEDQYNKPQQSQQSQQQGQQNQRQQQRPQQAQQQRQQETQYTDKQPPVQQNDFGLNGEEFDDDIPF